MSEGIVAAIPCPIPYQGSKRKLAPAIVACLPADAHKLYEPFCGSAAVSLAAAASHTPPSEIYLNDTNEPLVRLWHAIVEDPDGIAGEYEELWRQQLGRERAFYDLVRKRFNQGHQPELLLYLLARCVKAAVRYNANGEFNQSPDNRRLGARPERMRAHIRAAATLLRGRTRFSSVDFVDATATASSSDVIYMDPPYQGVSTNRDRRYRDTLEYDEFVDALALFNDRQLSFIVSYDGRTGTKTHGRPLPERLRLSHLELAAGRSTQATFLGRTHITYESLYLSPALVERLSGIPSSLTSPTPVQEALL